MSDKRLDLYLLRCLVAFVSEEHVTRAAERMDSTQPAMSTVLRRLRRMFKDPLLVRTDKGMVATPGARELAESFRSALDIIDSAMASGQPFDAASATMTFELAASESVTFMLVPQVVARVREQSRGVRLKVRIADLQRARNSLEEGEIDLLLSFTHTPPERLHSSLLWSQKLVVVAAGSHPVDSQLTLEDFLRWPHAYHRLADGSGSSAECEVDRALQKLELKRAIGVWLPSSVSVPPAVACNDFFATVPEPMARRFSAPLGLKVFDVPLDLHEIPMGMYWHERMQNNPAHHWLRGIIRSVAAEAAAGV